MLCMLGVWGVKITRTSFTRWVITINGKREKMVLNDDHWVTEECDEGWPVKVHEWKQCYQIGYADTEGRVRREYKLRSRR